MATTVYDQTRDLFTGAVSFDNIDPVLLPLPIEELSHRFLVHREWDVSEISMAKYVSMVASGDESVTAIPVFLSRVFRHSSIYVRSDSGVAVPQDLTGRTLGVPEWAQTAAVYSRGLLAHEYGVAISDVAWVQAGVNEPGRREHVQLYLPPGVTISVVQDRTLNDMLLSGDVDAVLAARAPRAAGTDGGGVRPLFADSAAVEKDYFTRTGIFPIMHTVVLKRSLVDANPWLPASLFRAFSSARDNSLERLNDDLVARFPVPWLADFTRQVTADLGGTAWPYGVESNRKTLEAFVQYAHEQGIGARQVSLSELFPLWSEALR